MHLTFEEFDFCGENAARTARIMRAIADAADPAPIVLPHLPLNDAEREAMLKHAGPVFANCGPMAPQPLGTVATHVSAAAVGDVPFGEVAENWAAARANTEFQVTVSPAAEQAIAEVVQQAAAATVAEMAPPAALGVDAEGYPWDERIHASSRNTVADGTWRKKRGVDEALVAQVRAEWDAKLRGAAPSPTEAERLQADHVDTMPIDPATVGFGAAPAQVPPPPPAAPAGDAWPDEILGPRTDAMAPFPQFLTWANRQISAGTLDNARLLAVLGEHGVPIITGLAAPEHVGKIPAIARQLAGV